MGRNSRKQRAKARKGQSVRPSRAAPPAPAEAPPGDAVPKEAQPQEAALSLEALAAEAVPFEAPTAQAPQRASDEPEPTAEPEEPISSDHRASPRVSVVVDIHLASESHFFSGLSGDISEGGLLLSTYRSMPIGSSVDLEFSLPGSNEPVHARGQVRWLREHSEDEPRAVGIAFEDLSEDDRERIHRFCTIRPPLYYEDVG